MQLFYNPAITEESKDLIFDKEESRHIFRVLRKKEGDVLNITNGKGNFFKVEISLASPKQCIASVISVNKQESLPYHLHLAVAPTKLNDRYEWFLEKATEIGVSEITPIICDHSERKVIKTERFEKKIQSALKQSLKAYVPILNPAISLKEFLKQQESATNQKLIAHCEETQKESLKSELQAKHAVTILIGPEGDFSPNEILLAQESGFTSVSLGESRLRTETAAIVACHSVAFVNE